MKKSPSSKPAKPSYVLKSTPRGILEDDARKERIQDIHKRIRANRKLGLGPVHHASNAAFKKVAAGTMDLSAVAHTVQDTYWMVTKWPESEMRDLTLEYLRELSGSMMAAFDLSLNTIEEV